jgi:SurA N-terminal domain
VVPFRRPGLLAVAVAGLIALSACGDAFVSPAAVVGGSRISQAELDRAVRLDLATNPQDAFAIEGPRGAESRANVTRSVLRTLIFSSVLAPYARDRHLRVPEQQVSSAVAQVALQAGGQPKLEAALRGAGFGIDDLRAVIRAQLLINVAATDIVNRQVGASASTAAKNRAIIGWISDRLRTGLEVNPRYGSFDLRSFQLCPIVSTSGATRCPPTGQ